jgi:5-methylthioribose kinase
MWLCYKQDGSDDRVTYKESIYRLRVGSIPRFYVFFDQKNVQFVEFLSHNVGIRSDLVAGIVSPSYIVKIGSPGIHTLSQD